MKKVLLFILLFISVVANAQKGISYQAVILDPAKIELPGSDISGQPLVNGSVNVKFVILSGTNIQFEEVQQTKTDAYGLVNLTIGSVASSTFNTMTWDANQKSLQVFVSFNNGASYTKVSDQKLTYSPYALFAETAGKLSTTLGISGGGTGATTAVGARANLGLGNVDNTADADKPISAATQAALNLKANAADVNAALNSKASAAMLAAHMAITVDTSMLATKAALTDLNNFAPKASPTFTGTVSGITKSMVGLGSVDNTSDAAKPVSTATQTALNAKANSADVISALALKASLASPSLAGTPTAPTAVAGTNSNQIATTAFTTAAIATATAGASSGVADNSVTSVKIADGSIATADLANGAVTDAKITSVAGSKITGVIPVTSGGTGSSVKNFVDLTTNQTIAGSKVFSSDVLVNGVKVGRGQGNDGQNVAIGSGALGAGTGTRNTAVGYNAMLQYNGTSFDNNTSVGYFNMVGLTSGGANTSMGGETMFAVGSGENNTAIGNHTLMNATTNGNTVLGADAGNGITSGAYNTFIGFQANASVNSVSNSTALGYGAQVVSDNTIQLGNAGVTNVMTSGSVNANSYIKTGGTSSQFLMADGSVSSNQNLVDLGSTQTLSGQKSFTGTMLVGTSSATGTSAALEVKSTTQGLLLPRLTASQRDAIVNPTQGLMVFCTSAGPYGQLQVYNGSAWTNFIGGTSLKPGKLYNYRSSILYSFDGSTWSNTGIGVPNNGFNGASGTRSYIGTIGGKTYHHDPYSQITYSFDGVSWTTESSTVPNNGFNGAIGGRSYVGVINNKAYHWDPYTQLFYSFNGTTWATVSGGIPNSGFNGAVGSRSLVGVLNNKAYHWDPYAQVFYSFDGTTWATVPGGVPNSGFNGAISSRSYVGVINNKAYHYDPYGQLFYSFDGTSWTTVNSTVPNFNGSLGMGRSYVGELENKAYHYNSYTSTLYSFDGTAWQAISTNTPSSIGGWFTDMGSTSFIGIAW